MKSILIIGMGKFGKLLGSKLLELGNEVMIVDKDEEIINELAPMYTNSYIGNCTNDGVLRSLGVKNFDICFVAIGDDFQSSLEITSQLKELGAKYVISKAERDIQAKFLLRNGADEIIYPERDVAIKLATRCNAHNIFDFIELTSEVGIFEIAVPNKWVKHTLAELNIRKKYRLNVLAIKKGSAINPIPEPGYAFVPEDHIVVMGNPNDVIKISGKKA
ncbi:MAG: TrkA family potassium uptake protein [Clostridiales bacterium]|nr:TrkA family potassium uptake protein [Clostridiales bacterium]